MRSIAAASILLLANGVLAQYGQYGGGTDDNSGTPISSVDDNSGTPVSSVSPAGSLPSTSSTAPSTAPTSKLSVPAGKIEVHRVKVSNKNGDLTFEPNNLQANPGSMVQFQFYPKVMFALV